MRRTLKIGIVASTILATGSLASAEGKFYEPCLSAPSNEKEANEAFLADGWKETKDPQSLYALNEVARATYQLRPIRTTAEYDQFLERAHKTSLSDPIRNFVWAKNDMSATFTRIDLAKGGLLSCIVVGKNLPGIDALLRHARGKPLSKGKHIVGAALESLALPYEPPYELKIFRIAYFRMLVGAEPSSPALGPKAVYVTYTEPPKEN